VEAIPASWTKSTCGGDPEHWSAANPARGQCDVSSLVVLEYLGGDLQLAPVYLGGEQVEFHYWNRLAGGEELDLTGGQFVDGQRIGTPDLVTNEFIRSNFPTARSELRQRHRMLLGTVIAHLGRRPAQPLNPGPSTG
jgi:hypothetical protein